MRVQAVSYPLITFDVFLGTVELSSYFWDFLLNLRVSWFLGKNYIFFNWGVEDTSRDKSWRIQLIWIASIWSTVSGNKSNHKLHQVYVIFFFKNIPAQQKESDQNVREQAQGSQMGNEGWEARTFLNQRFFRPVDFPVNLELSLWILRIHFVDFDAAPLPHPRHTLVHPFI